MEKRKYTKTRRAEQQDGTRARIVEATVKLHEALGPAQTSIKAIAEAAGVQRLTVYRHFPDDASLFDACASRYMELHPPPDPAAWTDIADPAERSAVALLAFYRYYRTTEKMWRGVYRDLGHVAAIGVPLGRFERYLDEMAADLARGWPLPGASKALKLTLRHALRFPTWQSLASSGLKDAKITALVRAWLSGLRNGGEAESAAVTHTAGRRGGVPVAHGGNSS